MGVGTYSRTSKKIKRICIGGPCGTGGDRGRGGEEVLRMMGSGSDGQGDKAVVLLDVSLQDV